MPRRFKVVSVNRINNCCPIYATEAPFISHPDQTGHACTIQNQSYYKQWTIENTKRLHMLCDDVVQQISVQSALGLHSLFCRLMQSEWKPVQRKSQNVEKDERCQKKRVKITWCQFCVQWTVKNEAQSSWKKPRGGGGCGQFAVFAENVDFSRLQTKLACVLKERENATKKDMHPFKSIFSGQIPICMPWTSIK